MRKIYESNSTDPYFNLALEEYLFRIAKPEDRLLYLWQNGNTVVIGRNQNPWKECNLDELEKADAKLVRRLSGGGAVYHDLGNLNFTFISCFKENAVGENIEMIIRVLRTYGIEASFNGKNDIQAGQFKFSGNAYFEENNILCHHGTLLIDTDVGKMAKMLTVSPRKLESKGVDSVKSRIINLKELNPDISVNLLKRSLADAFWNIDSSAGNPAISEPEIIRLDEASEYGGEIALDEIMALRDRYLSRDWNFGSSPEFGIKLYGRYDWGEAELYLAVEDGIIKKAEISTDSLDVDLPSKIKKNILNTPFNEKELMTVKLPEIVNGKEIYVPGRNSALAL
ncbi:MAG: lipoate--protein ligase [Clostridiales bacterium]|nr:lipoate--protein ligase [Clostridiales bacterium]